MEKIRNSTLSCSSKYMTTSDLLHAPTALTPEETDGSPLPPHPDTFSGPRTCPEVSKKKLISCPSWESSGYFSVVQPVD